MWVVVDNELTLEISELRTHNENRVGKWNKLVRMAGGQGRVISLPGSFLRALDLDADRDLVGRWLVKDAKLSIEIRYADAIRGPQIVGLKAARKESIPGVTSPIFLGCRDVAEHHYRKARDPTYRREHQIEYDKDVNRYGEELTLARANDRLSIAQREIGEFLVVHNKSTSQEMMIDTRWNNDHSTSTRLIPKDVVENTLIGDYIELGQAAQLLYAEKLPTIRLWLHWNEYVLGGVPDGVTDDYVYEFKTTTRSDEGREEVEKRALQQARLYAYLFRRPEIRVQIAQFHIPKGTFPIRTNKLPKPDIATITEHVADESAIAMLKDFNYAFRYR